MNTDSIHLLLVEDNDRDAELFREYLSGPDSPDHGMDRARSMEEAQNKTSSTDFDLVILDLDLGDVRGLETFESMNEHVPNTPIVVLTGEENETLAHRMIEAGAQDYLVKEEVNGHWLNKAVRYAVERHRAQVQHRESEKRYRAVFEQASEPIFIESFDDTVLDTNQAGCELLGYDRDEVVGMDLEDIVGREHIPDEGGIIENEMAKYGGELFETTEFTRDGRRIPVEVKQSEITYGDQQAVLSFVRDVSDRKEAERALRESEQRFREMAETIEEGFWICDGDMTELKYSNESFDTMFDVTGETPSERLESFYDGIHPEDTERIERLIERLTNGEEIDDEYRYVPPEGGVLWTWVRAYPVVEDGEVRRIIGTNVNITEQKQAERALRESEQRFRQMTDTVNDVFWLFSGDWTDTLFISEVQYEDTFGMPYREVKKNPKNLLTGVHPEDRDEVRDALDRISQGEAVSLECRVNPQEDFERVVRAEGFPISDENGEVNRVTGTFSEITEQRRLEDELEAQNKRLELAQEIANVGHWRIFLPDREVHWSDEVYRILGRNPDEPEPPLEEALEIYHPEDQPRIKQQIEDAIEHGEGVQFEMRVIRPDGEVRHVQGYGIPRYRDDGSPRDLFGVFQDITKMKQYQQDLEQRYNEQRCLYAIAELPPGEYDAEDTLLREIADRIPPGFQSSSKTHARITLDGTGYTSDGFRETDQRFSAPVEIDGETVGQVEIFHGDESTEKFSTEEKNLVFAIAREISSKLNRRRAEEEITRQAEFLDAINDRMPGVAYQLKVDPEGHYTFSYMSEGYEKIAGVNAERAEESFEEAVQHVHPDDREDLFESIQDVQEGPSQWRQEFRYRLPDGNVIWVLGSSTPDQRPDGTIVYSGVLIDITERKKAEQQLRQSEQRFRELTENIDQVFWVTDPDFEEFEYVSPRYEDWWNQPVDDLYENRFDWANQVHPDDLESLKETIDTHIVNAETIEEYADFEENFRVQREDGGWRWCHAEGIPHTNSDGDVTKVLGFITDITNRMEIEEALRDSEQRFRQMAENIEEVFWISDPDTQEMLYVSPAYEEIWGCSVESLYENPRSFLDVIHPDDREQVEDELKKQAEGNYDIEYRIQPSEDETRWIRDRAFPIEDEDGEVRRITGLAEDITEQKQIQQELEASIKQKELLLQEVHHRVRNNLQLITSLLGLQTRETSDDGARNALSNSRNRIQSMALIHRKLYETEDLTTVDFSEYVEELTRLLTDELADANSNIEVTVDVEEDLELDNDSLIPCGLIINELVTNSIKHGFDEGDEGTIEVRFAKPNDHYEFVIADDGEGADAGPLEDNPSSLGLRMVKTLVENQLHGSLDFSTGPGEGLTAEIQFPPVEERYD